MDVRIDPQQDFLRSILANIGLEICRPLESLQGGIATLLDGPAGSLGEAEMRQALTMRELCEELGRLTRESLGTVDAEGVLSPPE